MSAGYCWGASAPLRDLRGLLADIRRKFPEWPVDRVYWLVPGKPAGSLLQQEGLKSLIGERRVADAMKRDFPRVPGDLTVPELVDKYVLPAGARYFVVNGTGGAAGLVTLASIKETPRPAWPQTTVSQVMVPLARAAGHDSAGCAPMVSARENGARGRQLIARGGWKWDRGHVIAR